MRQRKWENEVEKWEKKVEKIENEVEKNYFKMKDHDLKVTTTS